MKPVSFPCNPDQAMAFSAGHTDPMGYMTHLKIGDHEFKHTTEYRGPEKDKVKAVGVLRGVHWQGAAMAPITIGAYVHREIAKVAFELTDDQNKLSNTTVKIGFKVFQHTNTENGKGEYFEYFWSDGEIEGVLTVNDGEIALSAELSNEHIYKGVYYPLSIRIAPHPTTDHKLHVQRTPGAKQAAAWGNKTSK